MTVNLYEKYNVPAGLYTEPLSVLYFILRKAELGKCLTDSEWQWLLEREKLTTVIEVIKAQLAFRSSIEAEINQEIRALRENPFALTVGTVLSMDTMAALVLYKLHNNEDLLEQESRYARSSYKTFILFNRTKIKLGVTEDIPFCEEFIEVLNAIDSKRLLSASNLEWLFKNNVFSILNLINAQFLGLCEKFGVANNRVVTPEFFELFVILQKLEEALVLSDKEQKFLKSNGYSGVLELAFKIDFSKLKQKYQATQFEDTSPTNHLYKVLKRLSTGEVLSEADLNFLQKRKLNQTLKIALKNDAERLINKIKQGHGLRPDDIAWCKQHDYEEIVFSSYKKDYNIEHRNDSASSPLYAILEKLEAKNRLTDEEVVWLESEKWCSQNSSRKIFIAFHRIEAVHSENEFQRNKNHWNLANASAHWRKAEEPASALKLTSHLDSIRLLKENKLKGALLTTRGGALRDIDKLEESEQCALEAIEHYTQSHNPYTLMGALCYDTKRYEEGDKWFEEAVKRGAKPKDQDAEIRRILQKKKGKDRQALIDHLLQKDAIRFNWVKLLAQQTQSKSN